MVVYDMAYSLNAQVKIEAETYEEAEAKLEEQLKAKGVDLEDEFSLEVFDVVEE